MDNESLDNFPEHLRHLHEAPNPLLARRLAELILNDDESEIAVMCRANALDVPSEWLLPEADGGPETALCFACKHLKSKAASALLNFGADANQNGSDGLAPAHLTVQRAAALFSAGQTPPLAEILASLGSHGADFAKPIGLLDENLEDLARLSDGSIEPLAQRIAQKARADALASALASPALRLPAPKH